MPKRTISLTLAALVVASATAFALPAQAQENPSHPGERMQFRAHAPHAGAGWMHRRAGPAGLPRGGIVAFSCDEQGTDRLEHMLLTLAQRTDPTAEQLPLYDALKDTALAAQGDFAAACAAARPQDGAAPVDLADRLKVRLAIETAHVAAMTVVVPVFEAFYDSLTEAQQAALRPEPRQPRRHLFEERGHDNGAADTEPDRQG